MDAENWWLHEINLFPTPENLWKEMVGLADRDVGGIVTVSVLSDQRCAVRARSHKPPTQCLQSPQLTSSQ